MTDGTGSAIPWYLAASLVAVVWMGVVALGMLAWNELCDAWRRHRDRRNWR